VFEVSDFWQVIILAVVQGVAEFLPISSSGHLVAVEALLGKRTDNTELSIVLHFGTLLAILVFYRRRIAELLQQDRRVIFLMIIGTIPAAVLGIYLKKYHESLLKDPLLTGFMLVVTGFILTLMSRLRPGRQTYQKMGAGVALMIGLAQACALLPGISRSGSTIVMGAVMGLQRQSAATFSFLLAIPAIGGASLLEARDILQEGASMPLWLLAVGAAVAFAVGLVALGWLVRWVEQGKLHWFAYWLFPFGFFMIVWQLNEIASRASQMAAG
jgi:undecaprenyl-diphosphatase